MDVEATGTLREFVRVLGQSEFASDSLNERGGRDD